MAMAVYNEEERRMVLDWFETDFRETAKRTTEIERLQDGRVRYEFSAQNDSGINFDRFSFKVRIVNKADGSELGTATIRTGAWPAGQTKKFKSSFAVPEGVRSLSFVMFAESVDYEGQPADKVAAAINDLKDLGDMITGADGSGGVLGELFGTGGMPETTTASKSGQVRRETTTTRQTSGQSRSSSGNRSSAAQSFTRRKTEKKLNKIRLGKSGGTVASVVGAVIFAMAAMGSTDSPTEMIEFGVVAALLAGLAAGLKIFKSRKARRIRAYEARINYKGNTSIDDLAAFVGRSPEKVADDLQKMIVDGFFPEAYVDINNRVLVMTRDGEPIESPEKTAAANKKAKRKAAREQGLVPESIDDLITMTDDKDIKAKLRALRTLQKRIDQRIEEKPELASQVRDFREKFYPEVVRLTDEYNEKIANLGDFGGKASEDPLEINADPNYLERQAREIKEQLISLIDSVTEASENMLEKLHEDDLMDIQTDIQMLQTTLASKGLLDSDFDL